ncbi:hypothetical protein AOQ71_41470 [Bradyrhizobium manausense]|uniref:Uncharacterized protein n=1 Tax=Bradyrhizobium manausense TaxID=989370 RepID=A0A0R3CVA7_9BRAD|nr:hypothetical protein AOQ71_41470 [Bradyrhizobium manausense]
MFEIELAGNQDETREEQHQSSRHEVAIIVHRQSTRPAGCSTIRTAHFELEHSGQVSRGSSRGTLEQSDIDLLIREMLRQNAGKIDRSHRRVT